MRTLLNWFRETHFLTWLITFLLDLSWNLFEAASLASIIILPCLLLAIFAACFTGVLLVQRFVARESWGRAAAKGAVFGTLAAVPFSVFTLLFAGLYGLLHLAAGGDEERQFGQLGLNYRTIEQSLRAEAQRCGLNTGDPGVSMETIIAHLYERGRINYDERNELDALRRARNYIQHVGRVRNMNHWVGQSYHLAEYYRDRFG